MPISVILIAFSIDMSPLLAFPDKEPSGEKYNNTNCTNRVEDVGNADCIDPWHKSEHENGAERVSGKRQADENIADDLVPRVSYSLSV